jgi:hypothetical protein
MEHVHAIGTFVRFGGETFRTEARLYFRGGGGKDLLLIGMNPGSSMLAHGREKDLKLANEGEYITDEIVIDSTMKHIVQMMDEACPDFNGTLYIVNLFNIRCGNMDAGIRRYSALRSKKDYLPYLITDFRLYMKEHSFSAVWFGWSQRNQSNINKRKKLVKRTLASRNLPVAKYKDDDQNSIHVWHFRPLLHRQMTGYRNYMVPLLRDILRVSEISVIS